MTALDYQTRLAGIRGALHEINGRHIDLPRHLTDQLEAAQAMTADADHTAESCG